MHAPEAHEGRGAGVSQGNIAHPPDCERVIKEIVDQHGRLDIVVNNAGITVDRTVRKMTGEEWAHVIDVNLNGAFYGQSGSHPYGTRAVNPAVSRDDARNHLH